jgi:hypothetical protein
MYLRNSRLPSIVGCSSLYQGTGCGERCAEVTDGGVLLILDIRGESLECNAKRERKAKAFLG